MLPMILLTAILWQTPGCSQPLNVDVNGFTISSSASARGEICLSPEEWDALEDQIWAETQRTVEDAVRAAVVPYVAAIEQKDRQIKGLRTTLVVTVSISAVCLGGWALMSLLK
jgi:hypothetical protein